MRGGEIMNKDIEPVFVRVAEAMKHQRLLAGYSQAEMAKIFDIPTNTYRGYENADRRMQLNTLIDIAKYFGLSVNYFMDYGLVDETAKSEDTKNKIVLELDDADVVAALAELQEMDKEHRGAAYEYLDFLTEKQKKAKAKIDE
jgi:transcriptional regulator with XRE-family HTH domain